MDYKQFGDTIIQMIGGADNVTSLEHCMTRLRFSLKDAGKADTDGLKKLKGVMGVVNAKQYQVVLGGEVMPTFHAIMEAYSFGGNQENSHGTQNGSVKQPLTARGVFENVLDYLSGTMVQIIPLFIACGLINCIISVSRTFFDIDTTSSTYLVLYSIANVPFYFLPVLVGFAGGRKLNCNPFLGALLGLFLLHPSFTGLIGTEGTVLFGIPFPAVSYSSTVFPVLFGVWILSKVEPLVYQLMPKVLKTIFGPFLCVVIMCPLMLFIVGPVGYYIGQYLANGILSLQNLPMGLGCAILSAIQPVLVLFGAHTVLAPPMIESIGTIGYDALIRPAFIMASFGHFGATLAITLKCKNKDIKGIAAGATVTSFLGTNEPSMYALEVPLVRPFVAALTGAFAGGIISSLTGAKAYAMGKNGVFGWLVFEDTIVMIILASLVSAAVAFAVTWIWGFDESKLSK